MSAAVRSTPVYTEILLTGLIGTKSPYPLTHTATTPPAWSGEDGLIRVNLSQETLLTPLSTVSLDVRLIPVQIPIFQPLPYIQFPRESWFDHVVEGRFASVPIAIFPVPLWSEEAAACHSARLLPHDTRPKSALTQTATFCEPTVEVESD